MDNYKDELDDFYQFNEMPPYVPAGPDEDYDFEDWEIEYELFEHEDWTGLIRYRLAALSRHPDSHQARWGVGDAYVHAGQYQKALEYLAPLHRQNPDAIDIQWSILDALFGLGKTENDFDWVKKPAIWRVNEALLNQCYQYLRPKRKPRSVLEICCELSLGLGYRAFKEEELLAALKSDARFKVEGQEFFESEISVRRKPR